MGQIILTPRIPPEVPGFFICTRTCPSSCSKHVPFLSTKMSTICRSMWSSFRFQGRTRCCYTGLHQRALRLRDADGGPQNNWGLWGSALVSADLHLDPPPGQKYRLLGPARVLSWHSLTQKVQRHVQQTRPKLEFWFEGPGPADPGTPGRLKIITVEEEHKPGLRCRFKTQNPLNLHLKNEQRTTRTTNWNN